MNTATTWFLVATIAAFTAGVTWYKYSRLGDTGRETSSGAVLEAGLEYSAETKSVFSLFNPPRELPELRFLNRKDREITLKAFKGTVVLLNIWATWCAPCREEMPALDRLQAQLGGPDFEVIALSIDRGRSTEIEKFYAELELDSLKRYHAPPGGASFKLEVPGIPATILIDREGRGLGYRIGPAEWDSPEIVREIKSYINPNIEN